MNLIKVMNFSGAGEPINFSFPFIWCGLERPEPAALHLAFFGHRDAVDVAGRVEAILADAADGGLLA
jgi:hypothetical protein